MKITIKNIGPINEVKLDIRNFTLIGGENQVGKSFITKSIYSLLEPCTSRYCQLEKSTSITSQEQRISNKWRWVFQQVTGTIINYFNKAESGKAIIDDILTLKVSREDKKNVTIKLNQYPEFNLYSLHYVATPAILDLEKALGNYREFYKNNYGVIDSYWDILRDIRNIDKAENPEFEKLSQKITKIIGGSFRYETPGGIIFSMGNKKIQSNQLGYGIKIFGILQLLIERDLLRSNSMLILEEPEVHLHPSMRFVLMDILNELVQNNVKIIFTTHSPEIVRYLEYMINTKKLDAEQCSFLHLRLNENACSSSSLDTLTDLLNSLTTGYYQIVMKEEMELD
ncbi:ATPase AAA-type core domain-containing protein [Candidatus Magnetomoraceae bacterium gMMP-1]